MKILLPKPHGLILGFLAILLLGITAAPSLAQQITGTPGSPSATTTLDGKQLPPRDPKFGGVIKEKASESQAWWAAS
jgi:arylsulfatase